MSGFIALLVQFLPILLQILSALFGASAALSYTRIDAAGGAEALLSSAGATYVGGQGLASIVALAASQGFESLKRKQSRGSLTFSAVVNSLGAVNFLAGIKLLARVIVLIREDDAASRLFEEFFGRNPSSVPTDADALARELTHASH